MQYKTALPARPDIPKKEITELNTKVRFTSILSQIISIIDLDIWFQKN